MTITKKNRSNILRLCYSALCLALCMVLPLLTGQIQQLGNALCPMHLPVLLCGILCGWQWGFAVGAIAPVLRFAIFQMPPIMPIGFSMMFELAVYGLVIGILYRALPKKLGWTYVSLVGAMIAGRIAGGLSKLILIGLGEIDGYSMAVFFSSYFLEALPGIVLQLVLIPLLTAVLAKARLIPQNS